MFAAAAGNLFNERGRDAVSIETVAKKLAMSRPTF